MVLGFVWKVVVLIDIIPGFKLFNDLLWRLYLLSLTFLHNFLEFKVWQKYILWSWRNNSKLKWNTSKPIIGQLILKFLCGVFKFFKKTYENKSNFYVRFLEELRIPKSPFEINWPYRHIFCIVNLKLRSLVTRQHFRFPVFWFSQPEVH